MHEEHIKLLRESGDPEKRVIASLLENGFSLSIERTMEFCREEGISPGDYARGLMTAVALEVAAFCTPQEDPMELGKIFPVLFANALFPLITPKKGDGHD